MPFSRPIPPEKMKRAVELRAQRLSVAVGATRLGISEDAVRRATRVDQAGQPAAKGRINEMDVRHAEKLISRTLRSLVAIGGLPKGSLFVAENIFHDTQEIGLCSRQPSGMTRVKFHFKAIEENFSSEYGEDLDQTLEERKSD